MNEKINGLILDRDLQNTEKLIDLLKKFRESITGATVFNRVFAFGTPAPLAGTQEVPAHTREDCLLTWERSPHIREEEA